MNIQDRVIDIITDSLKQKLECLIIEGLKRKGFEFENEIELEKFIKKRCKKKDLTELKKHIYYVDEIPFLAHYYEVIIEPDTEINNTIKFNANYGSFAFL